MNRILGSSCLLAAALAAADAAELHVAVTGDDAAPGTAAAPLRTIQRAAGLAQPGDTVTVHAGTYRERVNPPRGGESDARRIVYQAAPGEVVEVKGSEVVTGWADAGGGVWQVTLPQALFGGFNPFADEIRGDWFDPRGRTHHTGAVYLDGEWLIEAATLDEVLRPDGAPGRWFAQVDGAGATTIRARFGVEDPNRRLVEVNVRRAVFYPDRPGRDFITVRGFRLRHAATPWAPPTAEQVGLMGTHWSRGWVIEDNVVSHSACAGITLGKHGDEHDNTSANTAEGYVRTIERAHAFRIPWTRDRIGHHLVRNNTISHCEQAGIVGSLGAAFSTVTGNTIHEIHVRRLFSGAEMAGIKLHAAIDTTISRNHIFRCCQGLWLDWMAQGTRVTANLFHDNLDRDLFVEVNHGPFVVDNNLFLSASSLLDMSQGGAYAHNLFGGTLVPAPEMNRETPWHPAHSTVVAGLARIPGGDNRFFNNLFIGPGAGAAPQAPGGHGLQPYDGSAFPQFTGGNVYFHGARPLAGEQDALVPADHDPQPALVRRDGGLELRLDVAGHLAAAATAPVTSARLGKARVSGLPYVRADDSPLVIDADFLGKPRDPARPTPGPLENPGTGVLNIKLR